MLVISHARRRWHEAPPPTATYGLLSWVEARTVVVVRESWKQGRTVAVVAADAERDRSTLAVAIELARSERLPLTVLVPAGSSPDLAGRIDEIASESGSQMRREELSSGAAALLDAARRLEPLALVVAAGDPTLDEESLSHLLDELPCALVVAR